MIVEQRLVKDSFELYPVGTFPLEGGWQDGSLLAAGVAEGGEPVKEGQAAIRAVVDDGDSYRGLQSFKLGLGDLPEVVVSKRLSLPARAPFGVGEGSFAIGVVRVGSEAALLPRNRLVAEADADDLPEPTPVSDESALSPEVPSSGTPSGEPMAPLSALPVGSYYIYSFDGRLMQVYDMFGALLKDYIYMGDRMIAEYDHIGQRFLYYTPDQINSTRVVTDSAGTVVYSAAHDPYGGIQQTWVSTFDPMPKFSGKERDTESGLDYFGARYYDRNIYRFISVDPVLSSVGGALNPQNWNLYLYCRVNPVSYFDPDGRDVIPAILPGVGGLALHSYVDSSFIGNVGAFIRSCAAAGIDVEVTYAYRTRKEQVRINPKVKDSLHSAGWAIDINLNGLSGLQTLIAVILAKASGLSWGGDWQGEDYDPVHFYSEPDGNRSALIDKAVMTIAAYEFWGIAGLSSKELYMLYGVFTERAAWLVVDTAETDLRSNK